MPTLCEVESCTGIQVQKITEDDHDDVEKPSSLNKTENSDLEEPVSPEEWLKMTSDDELDDSSQSVGEIVNKLLKSARQHKSFIALYKLQAVKNYLELMLKYLQNPSVKNP